MLVRQVAILSISVIAVGKGCTGRSGAELDDGETTRKPEQWCARIRGHWPVYSPGQLTKPIHALHIHEAMQDKMLSLWKTRTVYCKEMFTRSKDLNAALC